MDRTAAAIAIYLEVLIEDHQPLLLPRDKAERLIALCRPGRNFEGDIETGCFDTR